MWTHGEIQDFEEFFNSVPSKTLKIVLFLYSIFILGFMIGNIIYNGVRVGAIIWYYWVSMSIYQVSINISDSPLHGPNQSKGLRSAALSL